MYEKGEYENRMFYARRVGKAGLRIESGGTPESIEDYMLALEKRGDERTNRREGTISGKLGEVHGYQFGSNLEERPDRFDLRLR